MSNWIKFLSTLLKVIAENLCYWNLAILSSPSPLYKMLACVLLLPIFFWNLLIVLIYDTNILLQLSRIQATTLIKTNKHQFIHLCTWCISPNMHHVKLWNCETVDVTKEARLHWSSVQWQGALHQWTWYLY